MASPLDTDAVERLCKLLGMLGSAHAGERAAAGLKADELIRRHGLQWPDVIRQPISTRQSERGSDCGRTDCSEHWRERQPWCLRRSLLLTAKELSFVFGLRKWRGPLTEKQQAWLDAIHDRLRQKEAA